MTTKTISKNLDIILISSGMIIGFFVILMHLTDMWPCKILDQVKQTFEIDTSFEESSSSNTNSDALTSEFLIDLKNDIYLSLEYLFRCG